MKSTEKLNRKLPPPIFEVTQIPLPTPSVSELENGIKVYSTLLGTQDVLKIELVIKAGRTDEHKKLVSRATSRLLREGTATHNSAEIADILDFYAGTLHTPAGMDTVNITLFCLTKYLPHLLPVFTDMLLNPTFPQRELDTFAENNVRSLAVELTKNDVLAYRKITAMIFGEDTAYGFNSVAEDYRALTSEDCHRHHREFYTADNMILFVSGKFDDAVLQLLNEHLGKIPKATFPKAAVDPLSISRQNSPQKAYLTNIDVSSQTSIRIGRPFGNRLHPDYNGFFVLNTILGGYFGSRLMTNIREAKGYTYNIYSSLDCMLHDGCFYVGSEVGNQFVTKALKEIYKEMALLQTELVGDEELSMVKNYLLGNLLTMIDGPFAVSDVIRTFISDDLPFSAWDSFVETIRTIEPREIQLLAQKYFNKEDMFEVIVGSKLKNATEI